VRGGNTPYPEGEGRRRGKGNFPSPKLPLDSNYYSFPFTPKATFPFQVAKNPKATWRVRGEQLGGGGGGKGTQI